MPKHYCDHAIVSSRDSWKCGQPVTHAIVLPDGTVLYRCESHMRATVAVLKVSYEVLKVG